MKKSLSVLINEIYYSNGSRMHTQHFIDTTIQNYKLFFNISSILDLKSLEESFHLLQSYKSEAMSKEDSIEKVKKDSSILDSVYNAIKPNMYWLHMIKYLVSKETLGLGDCHVMFYSDNDRLRRLFSATIADDSELNTYEVFNSQENALFNDKTYNHNSDYLNLLVFDEETSFDINESSESQDTGCEISLVQLLEDPVDDKEELRIRNFGKHKLVQVKTLKNICDVRNLKDGLFHELKWPEEEYYIDFVTSPNCIEKDFWSTIATFDEKHVGANHIVPARKVGRTLGIPTANIRMDRTLIKTQDLYPGVYYGKSKLIFDESCVPYMTNYQEVMDKMGDHQNKEYDTIYSIGPPLQYDIQDFYYEALILSKFPVTEFYGLKISSKIQGFIRPMAKFPNFDSFVKSMWCDIKAAKSKFAKLPKL